MYHRPGSVQFIHCVDRIYRDTPSARIDRLIPIWKQPSDGRLHTAASWEKEPPSHSRLHTAVSRGIKCLSHTYSETANTRGLQTAISQYIEQPPHSRLQTAAWRFKKPLSRNSCLTAFSKRLSCGEFQQKLSGGWYDSGYVEDEC